MSTAHMMEHSDHYSFKGTTSVLAKDAKGKQESTIKTHTGREDLLPLLDFFPITGVPKCSGLVSGSWSSVYMEKEETKLVCYFFSL